MGRARGEPREQLGVRVRLGIAAGLRAASERDQQTIQAIVEEAITRELKRRATPGWPLARRAARRDAYRRGPGRSHAGQRAEP